MLKSTPFQVSTRNPKKGLGVEGFWGLGSSESSVEALGLGSRDSRVLGLRV